METETPEEQPATDVIVLDGQYKPEQEFESQSKSLESRSMEPSETRQPCHIRQRRLQTEKERKKTITLCLHAEKEGVA